MFFITSKFLKVTHSFRNSSGYLHKWRLLLFTPSFSRGYKIVLKWVKVVALITVHCRSRSMNAYDFTDRAWEQVVFLANNTYFFPARGVFGTCVLIAILPSGANLFGLPGSYMLNVFLSQIMVVHWCSQKQRQADSARNLVRARVSLKTDVKPWRKQGITSKRMYRCIPQYITL